MAILRKLTKAFTRILLKYPIGDRKSTRLNSSHDQISYAVFCLKKKNSRTQDPAKSPKEGTLAETRHTLVRYDLQAEIVLRLGVTRGNGAAPPNVALTCRPAPPS